jgi:hypothetical protein
MHDFKNKTILSRDGLLKGVTTGAAHRCKMEGCTGLRLTTRWPDGNITHPCTKGLVYNNPDVYAQIV